MAVRETSIENYLKKEVAKLGGLCVKLSPLNNVGIPDRLILLPGGIVLFVETKKPKGAKIGALQPWWRKKLTDLGFEHHYAFTKADVDAILRGK